MSTFGRPQSPAAKIAANRNWDLKIVTGALGNIQHINVPYDNPFAFNLQQRIVKDLKKLAVLMEVIRDQEIQKLKEPPK